LFVSFFLFSFFLLSLFLSFVLSSFVIIRLNGLTEFYVGQPNPDPACPVLYAGWTATKFHQIYLMLGMMYVKY